LALCKKWELLREQHAAVLRTQIRRDTYSKIQESKEKDGRHKMENVHKALYDAAERLKFNHDERDSVMSEVAEGRGRTSEGGGLGEEAGGGAMANVRKNTFSDMAAAQRLAKRAAARQDMEDSYKTRRNEFVCTYIRQERQKVFEANSALYRLRTHQYVHGMQSIDVSEYKSLRSDQDVTELLAPKAAPVVSSIVV
jgi:hypothetical protein